MAQQWSKTNPRFEVAGVMRTGKFYVNDTSAWNPVTSYANTEQSPAFRFTIDTTLATGLTFSFGITRARQQDITTIYWGDGSKDVVQSDTTVTLSHEYSTDGKYQISVSGDYRHIRLGLTTSIRNMLISVDDWGVNVFSNSSSTSSYGMFYSCRNLKSIPDSSVKFVGSVNSMFYDCTTLTEINMTNYDMTEINNVISMFQSCSSLTKIESTENLVNSSVGSIRSMFYGCISLQSVDVSGWDTSSVTDMYRAFYNCGLQSVDVSGWDTSSVRDIGGMFSQSTSIKADVSGFNVSSVTSATQFATSNTIMDTATYDKTLQNWSAQTVNSGVQCDFGSCKYSDATARAALQAKGWTIRDGGPA